MNVLARLRDAPPFYRVLGAAGMFVAVAVGALTFSSARHSQVALYSAPLAAEQLAEVNERLAAWNVAFIPQADNVLVDASGRNGLLLRLSLAGVPHQHLATSSETLSKIGVLTPQSVLEAQTRDGLANDLALSLRGIDGVQDARVIIAPAKAGSFADESSSDATASVRLTLRPGAHLSGKAVAGMRAFIAAGVPALERSKVTILDDRGLALSDEQNQVAGERGELQSSLQSALDAAFGNGTSIVRVWSRIASDERERREFRRAPALRTPVMTTNFDESYWAEKKRYSKRTTSEDRGSVVREDRVRTPPGRLERLSIAVFVDANAAADVPKIRALVAAASGLEAARGDTLTVETVGFAHIREPRRTAWPVFTAFLPMLQALGIAFLALLAIRALQKPVFTTLQAALAQRSISRTRDALAGFAPTQVRGALMHEPPHTAAAIISALPAATAAAVLDLYPPEERAAIIRRMARPRSPLVPDFESVIANA